ncbi:MAG: GspMb/PilO family protein [Planctomycetota bacterium]|jgi:hypothetical protein
MSPIRKKYLAILAAVWGCGFLALFAFQLCLVLPQNEIFAFLQEKLQKKQLELNDTKLANKAEIRATWQQKVDALTEKLADFVAEPNVLDKLAFTMSKIAGEIKVDGYTSRDTSGELYSKMPNFGYTGQTETSISFNGTFSKLAKFINTLERNKPVIFIDSFTITKSQSSATEHKANILLKVLVRIPQDKQPEDGSLVEENLL